MNQLNGRPPCECETHAPQPRLRYTQSTGVVRHTLTVTIAPLDHSRESSEQRAPLSGDVVSRIWQIIDETQHVSHQDLHPTLHCYTVTRVTTKEFTRQQRHAARQVCGAQCIAAQFHSHGTREQSLYSWFLPDQFTQQLVGKRYHVTTGPRFELESMNGPSRRYYKRR